MPTSKYSCFIGRSVLLFWRSLVFCLKRSTKNVKISRICTWYVMLPFLRLQKSTEINILFICVKWCEREIKSLTITEFQLTKSARHKWVWFHWLLGTSPGNFCDGFGYAGEIPAIWFLKHSDINIKKAIIFFNNFQTLPSVWFVHGQYYCLLKEICPSKTMHLRWKLSLSVHQNCSTGKVKTSALD